MIDVTFCLLALLGKAGDWITVVVMAVGFIVWLIAQLSSQGAKAAQRQRRKPQPRRPAPPPRRPAPRRPVPVSQAGRRPTPPPRRPTPPPRPAASPPQAEAAAPRQLGTLEHKPPVGKKKVSSLEEHHLETSIKPQVSSLPEGTVPSNLEIHVEQTFSHELGQLPSEQRPEAEPHQQSLSPVAQEIVNTLRNPEDVRKAVVIAEILRRPEF